MRTFLQVTCWCVCLFLSGFSASGQSSSYYIRYGSTKRYFSVHQHLNTSDRGMVLVGRWGDREYPADLLVIKLDESGNLIWSKGVAVNTRIMTYNLYELNDGSIVFFGDIAPEQPPYISTLLLARINCKGELLWSKTVSKSIYGGISKDRFYPMSVREGKNRDIIIAFVNFATERKYMVIARVNEAGNLVWCQTFTGDNEYVGYPTYAFYRNNKILAIGYKLIHANYTHLNSRAFYAMTLNYDSGVMEEIKAYSYSDFSTGIVVEGGPKGFSAEPLADGRFALFGGFSGLTYSNVFYYKLILNADLSIGPAKYFMYPYALRWARINVFPNGQTSLLSNVYDTRKLYWYTEDGAGNKIREWVSPYPHPDAYLNLDVKVVPDGTDRSLRILSMDINRKGYIDLARADDKDPGFVNCVGHDTSYVKSQPWQVTPASLSWQAVTSNEFVLTPRADAVFDVPVTKEVVCGNSPAPEKVFELTGEDTVCAPRLEATYTVKAKRTLRAQTRWAMDAAYYQTFNQLNDSTLVIKFKEPLSAPQQVKLYSFTGDCQVFEDSLAITVFPGSNALPRTLTYCATPIDLHPGPWFKEYRWQDGSSDSVYTVSKPGTYRVTLKTYCNTTLVDTVVVRGGTTGIVTQAAVCTNDSTTLTAPPGFVDYQWTPAYNLLPLAENSVQVFPEKDTVYVLSAATVDGCALRDSISVTVKKTIINLGKDTVLCRGDVLLLQAGSGFQAYQWNNGGRSQHLAVTTDGTYTLNALDVDGCPASDTIRVTTKECPNSIHIPTGFTPNNDGRNDLFYPRITGRIVAYEFAVFNRWGTVVYKSTQPGNGWDGFYNGTRQNPGVFVWICSYQFANEAPKRARGTVTIIQ